ncbi:hypothetical protein [Acidovorax sp. LjRoot38]|uniref:hypothetical protein n=1 Tax=Acidovorax sp. LjRoot38 TaxID=3342327 RepID=UPI003F509979
MLDMPASEARALLAFPLICEDAPEWASHKLKPGLETLECGLLQNGDRSGLRVSLEFAVSPKTGLTTYKFTVFLVKLGGLQRVYQLQVNAVARKPKCWHDFVHEHMGRERIQGKQEWLDWGFREALDYFCLQTNITFVPPLTDPSVFELRFTS